MPYDTTVKSATAKKKKKKYVKLLVSMRFGQRRKNTAERRKESGKVQLSLLSFGGGNDFLWLADQELALTLPLARTQDEDLEHSQSRINTQLQVILNGNRKLEKTITSYANSTVMPCAFVCPTGVLYSSLRMNQASLSLPFHIINRHAKCKSPPDSDPIPAKHRDNHHTEFHNHLHNDNYSQPLSSAHTKDCNLNLASHRFSSVGAGYQANGLF